MQERIEKGEKPNAVAEDIVRKRLNEMPSKNHQAAVSRLKADQRKHEPRLRAHLREKALKDAATEAKQRLDRDMIPARKALAAFQADLSMIEKAKRRLQSDEEELRLELLFRGVPVDRPRE